MVGSSRDLAPRADSALAPPEEEVPAARPPERLALLGWERRLGPLGIAALERTQAALPPEQLAAWFDSLEGLEELVELRTCQRTFVLAVAGRAEAGNELGARLALLGPWEPSVDREAIHRLFEIVAGSDSLARGEREIRDQVRATAGRVASRHPRPILRRLLVEAADAADRHGRSDPASTADLAADWLRAHLEGRSPRIVIVGSGRVGRRAAERLAGRGAVTLVYRSRPPEAEWVARLGLRLAPSDELSSAIAGADAVVAAAKSSGRLVDATMLPPEGAGGPRWILDLGLPRNVDPSLAGRAGLELVDLERLAGARTGSGTPGAPSAELLAAEELAGSGFARAAVEPWVRALRAQAEEIRREEFDQARRFAGPVPPDALIAFERMSQRTVRRLLARPTAELRALPPDPEHDARRQLLLERFRESDEL